MKRIRLIGWMKEAVAERAARLRAAGYRVDASPLSPDALRRLRARLPAAVVVDLDRMPAQGRDVGIAIRHAAATRWLPIVFAGGAADKVKPIRRQVAGAVFVSWSGIAGGLRRAIANPPHDPVRPASAMAGYSGTPLPKKLGIKADGTVALVGAPRDFTATLGELPAGAKLRRRAGAGAELTIWFVPSKKELMGRIRVMAKATGPGGLWIAWPKKASGVATDLTQTDVRRAGLSHGLVDYKICAIDSTWSGLKFARRRGGTRAGAGTVQSSPIPEKKT